MLLTEQRAPGHPSATPKRRTKKEGTQLWKERAELCRACPCSGSNSPAAAHPEKGSLPRPNTVTVHTEHETDAGKHRCTCAAHQPWWLGAPAPSPADPEEMQGAESCSAAEGTEPALPVLALILPKLVPLFSH